MKQGYIFVVIVCITSLFSKTYAAETNSPKSDIEIYIAPTHSSCRGSAILARNKNDSSRILATISSRAGTQEAPPSYFFTVFDRYFVEQKDLVNPALPLAFQELFLPGEMKFIECGNSIFYRVLGAYYSNSDVLLPVDPKPDDFLRIESRVMPGLPGCPVNPTEPHEEMRVINTHPRYTLVFSYVNTTATRRNRRITLTPFDSEPIGCRNESGNISFGNFEFSK
jgi:hypothetical protein